MFKCFSIDVILEIIKYCNTFTISNIIKSCGFCYLNRELFWKSVLFDHFKYINITDCKKSFEELYKTLYLENKNIFRRSTQDKSSTIYDILNGESIPLFYRSEEIISNNIKSPLIPFFWQIRENTKFLRIIKDNLIHIHNTKFTKCYLYQTSFVYNYFIYYVYFTIHYEYDELDIYTLIRMEFYTENVDKIITKSDPQPKGRTIYINMCY